MIFTISSVCCAYFFGIFLSTSYIRNKNLVGAGFFWLMHSVCLAFATLNLISAPDSSRTSSVLLTFLIALQLLVSIFRKNEIKNSTPYLEKVLTNLILLCVLYILYGYVDEATPDGKFLLEFSRVISGGLLLGVVTSAMLLGHWYLVQPGLTRKPISKMCLASMAFLAINVSLWLVPDGMLSVLSGSKSDGWGGTLGYMWLGSCFTTAFLLFMAFRALKEKSYSAVMATTGLLYLAILVANGVELIPRAIFS